MERALAVFTFLARLNFSTEILSQELQAVANTQHRDAELENGAIGQRRFVRIDARRASGQNEALGIQFGDFPCRSAGSPNKRCTREPGAR